MREIMSVKKQEAIYLGIVLGLCFLLGIINRVCGQDDKGIAFQILQKGFTAFPVCAAFLTRRIAKSKESFHISLKVWKQKKLWLFSAVGLGCLIVLGATLYYLIFPRTYSGFFAYGQLMIIGEEIGRPVTNPLTFAAVCVVLGAILIPLQLFELGEEIGWRGYLLPLQIKSYGVRKAVFLNGFYWGIAHLPLIYFGFNYSLKKIGAPWTNMGMMMLVCFVIGTIFSYVTIKSGNCMYAAIGHGVINFIGEIPVFLSVSRTSGLLGPNPSGVIGMSGLIVCAIVMWVLLGKIDNGMNKLDQ